MIYKIAGIIYVKSRIKGTQMTGYYKRWQEQVIEKYIKNRRVLLLNGARQCGKTTLAKQLSGKNTVYRTLDDFAVRQLALNDPNGCFNSFKMN